MSFPKPAGAAERLAVVRSRIEGAGGDPEATGIVAVTKGYPIEAVREATAVGLGDLGENYASELVDKASKTMRGGISPRWHFLGAIQRNKVRWIARHVHLWHGVSRAVEGEEIVRWSPQARVLVQVDYTGRPGRGGCPEADAPELVGQLQRLGLDVRGLMTVAPSGDPRGAREAFRRLAALGRRLELPELSMGMTDDLELAVEEGATIVRVGRGLFGPRSPRRGLRQ